MWDLHELPGTKNLDYFHDSTVYLAVLNYSLTKCKCYESSGGYLLKLLEIRCCSIYFWE